ncbi:MAG: hypothetical protein RLZZ387_1799 [Chloroflexota bacterium]|jgi:hypothetical protein
MIALMLAARAAMSAPDLSGVREDPLAAPGSRTAGQV